MRACRPATAFAAILLCIGPLGAGTALAQSNPSADQIINSLKPGAGVQTGTRGIRPAGPAPAATASPAPGAADKSAAAAAPQAAPSVNLSVQFANGSAELTPAAVHTLDELGRALASRDLSSYRFRIEGHTDTVGSGALNQTLSEQRAGRVVEYLVDKFHLDRARLEPIGMGERGLLVPTPPQTPEPRNRRVVVVNLGA